ncbi:MAG TPA: hypothetical protein VGZ25_16390, partial [Gemmataceae bacterium]|nr:hypothetical protein [Gemmataceae bacterium]
NLAIGGSFHARPFWQTNAYGKLPTLICQPNPPFKKPFSDDASGKRNIVPEVLTNLAFRKYRFSVRGVAPGLLSSDATFDT